MRTKSFILSLLLFISFNAISQQPNYVKDGALIDGHNIVNVNITSPLFGMWNLSAERILTKNISVKAGLTTSPTRTIPQIELVSEIISKQTDIDDIDISLLKDITYNSFNFTPELRLYLGKGYGKGFYFSPYYRYSILNVDNFTYEDEVAGNIENVNLAGKFNTHSIGLMMGSQWLLGKKKNFVIDWNIIGLQFGMSNGALNGKYSGELNNTIRQDIQDSFDEFFEDLHNDVPLINGSAKIYDDNSLEINAKFPWPFLRSSISLGFRF